MKFIFKFLAHLCPIRTNKKFFVLIYFCLVFYLIYNHNDSSEAPRNRKRGMVDNERDIINYLQYPATDQEWDDLKDIVRYPDDPIHEMIEFKGGRYKFERDVLGSIKYRALACLLDRGQDKNHWASVGEWERGRSNEVFHETFEEANEYLKKKFESLTDFYEGFLEIAHVPSLAALDIVKDQLTFYIESEGERTGQYVSIQRSGKIMADFDRSKEYLENAIFDILINYRGYQILNFLGLDIGNSDYQEFARMIKDYQDDYPNNPERLIALRDTLYKLLFGKWRLPYSYFLSKANDVDLNVQPSFADWIKQLVDTQRTPSSQSAAVVCEEGHENIRTVRSIIKGVGCPNCKKWVNEAITGAVLKEIYGDLDVIREKKAKQKQRTQAQLTSIIFSQFYLDVFYKNPPKVKGISENLLVYDYLIIVTVGQLFKALEAKGLISSEGYKQLRQKYNAHWDKLYIKFYESDGILHRRDGKAFWRKLELGSLGSSKSSVALKMELEHLPEALKTALQEAESLSQLDEILENEYFKNTPNILKKRKDLQKAFDIDDYKDARTKGVDEHFILRIPTWGKYIYNSNPSCSYRIEAIFDDFDKDLRKLLGDSNFALENYGLNYEKLFEKNWRKLSADL